MFCLILCDFKREGNMIKDKVYYDSLTEQIISCAYAVGNKLGYGFLEKVYENSMAIELSKAKLEVKTQEPIEVRYEGQIVGDYYADMVVEDDIIVELKAIKSIDEVHFAQCLNYLKATGRKLGLLINFGSNKVMIRRVVNGL
jgi:GxxExxY protein